MGDPRRKADACSQEFITAVPRTEITAINNWFGVDYFAVNFKSKREIACCLSLRTPKGRSKAAYQDGGQFISISEQKANDTRLCLSFELPVSVPFHSLS